MNKFYYFSKQKLNFVEIKHFNRNVIFLILFSSTIISFLIFGSYTIINSLFNTENQINRLKAENSELKNELGKAVSNLKKYGDDIDILSRENNKLRLAVNLEELSDEDRYFGTGGESFEKITRISSSDAKSLVADLERYIEEVENKLDFEKNNFLEISEKLQSNKKLFAAVPAIRPCDGYLTSRFGVRTHPILGVKHRHEGIDITTNKGTPVYAPGSGIVDLIEYRAGYGLTLEIDHGFGYRTRYAHLMDAKVKIGAQISRGDQIARTGNSGLSTGPHLHYEVLHNGVRLDPLNFIIEGTNLF